MLTLATTMAHETKESVPAKFGIFRDDCYDKWFTKQDFSDSSCVAFTISKVLGYAIIIGSVILKLPQILKIRSSGSVEGISVYTYYVETIQFTIIVTYYMRSGLAFSVYGEGIIITA